jgi:formylglycine-generating enzyme required for sulfatase activity
VHEVHIEAFAIGATEVTRGDYQRFLASTGMPTQALSDQEERLPVTHVSYFDATAYAAWLSAQTGEDYTIPTEAEWEYAARANSPDNYSFGHEINCELARYDGLNRCGLAEAAPVASYPANAFGLYDMHGNVWEWTKDCALEDYSSFAGSIQTEGAKATDQTCHRAMLRGGSFNLNAHKLRVSYRSWRYKDYRHNDTGFRLVRRVTMNEE